MSTITCSKCKLNFSVRDYTSHKCGKGVENTPVVRGLSSTLFMVVSMWGSILLFSVTVSRITGSHWWEMIAQYVALMLCFYAWHWQAHRHLPWVPFNTQCKQLHMEHHWSIYPPKLFYGRDPTQGLVVTHTSFITSHEALLYVLMAAELLTAYALGMKPFTLVFAVLFSGVVGFVGNYLHQSFHITGHYFERFGWFHELRAVHYIHHLHSTNHNYAVFNIGIDWLMGSLVLGEDGPRKVEANATEGLGGVVLMTLGLQSVPRQHTGQWAVHRGIAAVAVRALIVSGLVWLWKETQIVFALPSVTMDLRDRGHDLTAAATEPQALVASLLYLEDILVVAVIVLSVVGPSVRALVGLFYALTIRQLLVYTGGEVVPSQSLWIFPIRNLDTLSLATHTNEQTISALMVLVTVCAVEGTRLAPSNLRRVVGVVMLAAMVYVGRSLLALRAMWTANIILGVIVARYGTIVASMQDSFWEGMLP